MAKVVMLVEMDIPDGNLERIHPGESTTGICLKTTVW